MNIREYIRYANRVLNEDAGSEGLEYKVKAKSGLKEFANDVLTIDEVKNEDSEMVARARFANPHNYDCALKVIKEAMNGIDITSLSLVY